MSYQLPTINGTELVLQELTDRLDKKEGDRLDEDGLTLKLVIAADLIKSKIVETNENETQMKNATYAVAVWMVYGTYLESIASDLSGEIPVAIRSKFEHFEMIMNMYLETLGIRLDRKDKQPFVFSC